MTTFHRILLNSLLGMFMSAGMLSAQRPVEVIINFMPPYPVEIAAYYNSPQAYSITAINYTAEPQTVYFLGELRGTSNGVLIRTLPTFRADVPVTIPPSGVIIMNGEEIAALYEDITLNDLEIVGIPLQDLNINGSLPEGEYVWCINVYDFNSDFQPLSVGCSAPFTIYYGDQLTIMTPFDEEVVLNEVFPIQWNPNMTDPIKRMDLEYEIKMIDLTEYEDTDLDLLFLDGSAQPVLERLVYDELYIYNSDGTDFELTEGHEYGVRVRAVDPFNEVAFTNNGYSEIRRFWYLRNPNEDEDEEDDDASNCFENCHYTRSIPSQNAANPESFEEWQIGYFTMTDMNVEQNSASGIQGTASIRVPWLNNQKIAVSFNDLKVNRDGRVYEGTAKAIDESDRAYDLGDVYNTLFVGHSECPSRTLAALSDDISTARSVFNMVADQASGVPLGINQSLEGRQFTIGVIDMVFTADRANIALINLFELGSVAENLWVSIAGNDICLTPDGLGGEYILHQAFEKRKVGFGNMDITTFGGLGDPETIKDEYCYIEMNCEGMKSMAIRGEVAFDRGTIVPDNNGRPAGGKVKGRFFMELDKRNDPATSLYAYNENEEMVGTHIMLGFDMDPFQIKGLEGWTFTPAHDAVMDMSDLENPDDMVFPEQYDVEAIYGSDPGLITTWQGFFMKQVSIQSPKEFSNGVRRSAVAENFIFDPTLTVDVGVSGLLSVGDGNIEGWGFSIDTFKIEIVQNTFVSGGMYGGINPPITGDGDYLNYKAILDRDENDQFSFYAVAMPDSLISIPVSLAKAALCPNSYVQFTLDSEHTEVSTFLKGQLVIDVLENLPPEIEIPDVIPGLEIRLADFQLNFNSTDGFVTEDMVSDGTGSAFGFGIDLQDATCGDLYTGLIFEFDGFEGYEYDVDDLDDLLREGLPNDASPQENVDKFPISINDIELGFSRGNVSIDFDIDVSLSTDMADFMIGTRLNMRSGPHTNSSGIERYGLTGIRIECGRFGGSDPDASVGFDPFTVRGEVCLEQNEDGSKGFNGDIDLGLGVFNMSLIAGFGTSGKPDDGEYGTRHYFGWWYFDGMARVFPGLPLVPPTVIAHFNGFGGGVYWNATAPAVNVSMEDILNSNDTTTQAAPRDSKPKAMWGNRTLAFRTSWNIIEDPVFMIDPYVAGTWNTQSGLQSISFGGNFWALALEYAQRSDARIYGSSMNTLTFMDNGNNPPKVAFMGTNTIKANIINGVLYGAGEDNALINTAFAIGDEDFFPGEPSNSDDDHMFWFFNAGNPYQNDYGGVVFDLPGFNLTENKSNGNNLGIDAGFSASIYAMIGQNIPTYLPDPPGEVSKLFGLKSTDEGSFSGGNQEDDRDPANASTGHGVVFGAHATAFCEIHAIFYASLTMFAGLDIMMVNMNGQSCYTSNGVVNNPGVNGWYGTGRAYTGLEGAIGVKGKIFGKEIDIKIIQLLAAMMCSAGGPKPMWLDGRATLQYNLLGGTIKGSTRMMISVGNKCIPPVTSPFDFPIIAEYYPNEVENRNIAAFVNPTVSFTVPINEILYIPDVNGQTQQIRPKLVESNFNINKDCDNCKSAERDTRYPLIAEDGRSAVYDPFNPLCGINGDQERKQYRMKIKVTAEEYKNNSWRTVKIDGENWEESFDFTFKTDAAPLQIPADEIGKTKPLTNQKFFLQNEMNGDLYVHAKSRLEGVYYYETDIYGKEYDYFALFKDNNGEELFRKRVTYNVGEMKLHWDKPVLDNNKHYIIQIVRKQRIENPLFMMSSRKLIIDQNLLASANTDSLNFQYQVEPELPEISPLTAVNPGEVLLHAFEFETSRYNTLNDKMEDATVDMEVHNGYQRLDFDDFEGFDIYDIDGWIDDHEYSAPPRVIISDPFTAPFHNNLSKPKLGNFAQTYRDQYAGEPSGLESEGAPDIEADIDVQVAHDLGADNSDDGGINGGGESGDGGSEEEHVPLDFPILIHTNYDWYHVDDVHQSLNEHAIRATILMDNDEDDGYVGTEMGNAMFAVQTPSNLFSVKYYVTEDILDDAQTYADFGEEWIDHAVNGNFTYHSLHYDQTLSAYEVNQLIEDLENVTNAIINSSLINGPGANGFSNTVRFRANKSFESGGSEIGTTRNMNFNN
ncbi:MAG TPA: hypothetical protein VFG10_05795 [Saprospiraceae bacterium]|nr:hypothetical protein [Saprospiraceae bacterium]